MKTQTLLIALAFLSACSTTEPLVRESPQTKEHLAEDVLVSLKRLVGTWARGQDRLIIMADQSFHWERERLCKLPPCPLDQSSGSFSREPGRLLFATVAGPPLILRYQLVSDPRRISIQQANGRTWTLPFVE